MKKMILPFLLLIFTLVSYSNEDLEERYIVYYFGASNCGYCNIPDNIKNIKRVKIELSQKYKDKKIKYVMVCFDNDIEEGLRFIKKYGYWDEISIGQRYYNELSLQCLNTTKIPGVPHIVVCKDTYTSLSKWSIPLIKERKVLVDLVGGKEIDNWIKNGYPLAE
jgi:thiol-disulfide isomerase/thioredoxin